VLWRFFLMIGDASVHASIRASVHPCMQASVHPCIQAFMHGYCIC